MAKANALMCFSDRINFSLKGERRVFPIFLPDHSFHQLRCPKDYKKQATCRKFTAGGELLHEVGWDGFLSKFVMPNKCAQE